MRAFIIRPFGTRGGINFDDVQKYLIAPALAALDIQSGTIQPLMQNGNIRADMFQQLLVADLVVADISIHDANVFYELGLRHALRPKRTFLLRAKASGEVPFDLRTDRYIEYDPEQPASLLDRLVGALRQTLASDHRDSPAFQMLPDLVEQVRSRFLPVPNTFRDDVDLALKSRRRGLLGLLAVEIKDFFWASEGWRLIGRAQFDLQAYSDAKRTWEELYKLNPSEPETNQRLGTIYQRLDDLDASDQALQRGVNSSNATDAERAEALSLIARNIKYRWKSSWTNQPPQNVSAAAFESPDLLKAYERYLEAFQENLDSLYAGLNALKLLTIHTELVKKFPEAWQNRFDSDAQSTTELQTLGLVRQNLAGAVAVALEASKNKRKRASTEDRWVDLSAADYLFLISNRPKKVALSYQSALEGASAFYFDSARAEIEIFQSLGVLTENTQAALAVFPPAAGREPQSPQPGRVILFTGHMIDEPGRIEPRFPDSARTRARSAIRAAVDRELNRTNGTVVGVASGANGGDLLFHDVCEELGVPHLLFLPIPADHFRNESVSPAGRFWEDQFDNLLKKNGAVAHLANTSELPPWLSTRRHYMAWQRANIWLIQEALALNAQNFTLLALWDGIETEGLGGTAHMRTAASQYGAALITIFTADLLRSELQISKQFFLKAGFEQADSFGDNTLTLRRADGAIDATVIVFQPDRPLGAASIVLAKTYVVYRDRTPAPDQLQTLRLERKKDVIPLSAAILERALFDKKTCAETLHELEEPFVARTDPYNESKPITDPMWFFGREDILKDLPSVLRHGQHAGLFGLRKMGKTSLIKQLQQRLITVPTVWIDCQGLPANAEALFIEICGQLRTELQRKIDLLDDGSSTLDFRSEILRLFSIWKAAAGQGPFVLILDEVDKLFPDRRLRGSDDILGEWVKLFRVLRALAQEKNCLVTLVTAYRPDVNRQNLLSPEIGENPMFMSFQERFLGSLGKEDTQRMISEIGAWKDIRWSDESLAEVYELCGGHPLITRFLASDACEQGDLKMVDITRVGLVAETIRRQFHKHLIGQYFDESIWKLLQSDEKEALVSVASAGNIENLQNATARLEHFGLIRYEDGHLRISSTLLKSWIDRKRPI